MKRPYAVYKEGNFAIVGGDPVSKWLNSTCAYDNFCQCELADMNKKVEIHFPENRGWHHLGALYGNVFKPHHEYPLHDLYKRGCVYGETNQPYPQGYNKSTMNQTMAIKLARIVVEVCGKHHPAFPERGVPLPSVLKTRPGKPNDEYDRYLQWWYCRYPF